MLAEDFSVEFFNDPRDKAIGNAIAEWDEGHYDERRNRIADISPVNSRYLTDHHTPDLDETISQCPNEEGRFIDIGGFSHQNKCTSRGPRRNGRKYRGKEDGYQETTPSHHGRESSASTLRNPGAALDKRRDRRTAE